MLVVLVTAYDLTTSRRDEEYCEGAWPSAVCEKGRPVVFVVEDAYICRLYRIHVVPVHAENVSRDLHVLTAVCE